MYKLNFQLCFFHGFDMGTLQKMVPWERYMMIDMVKEELAAADEARRDRQNT